MPNGVPKAAMYDLFDLHSREGEKAALASDAVVLRRFACGIEGELLAALNAVIAVAPLRNMVTPGGYAMSVAMTNCGAAGWVTDRAGYRYTREDPISGNPWPPMPAIFASLATRAAAVAGFEDFLPDACLINRYAPGTKLSLHQDKNETDFTAPIVSVSLGLPARFLFGGLKRADRPRRIRLESGDIAIWGGPSRLTYHGIAPLADGAHPATGRARINLTFRKAR